MSMYSRNSRMDATLLPESESSREGSGRAGKWPRVLLVVNTDWFFLSHRVDLARAVRAAGAEVIIVAPDTGQGEAIRREGFGFVNLPLSRCGTNLFSEMKTLLFLFGLYRRLRPDLV